ncbi:hypothetical protein [Corynebacterium bovis]|uniref:Putative small lipoprotein YifL n=1 Tax=Corynebacterium bovis DSM 20582 = CIP 54.80 TaxID=927655 RepID=A0A8H9YCV1_9CORY|nr:hypothetical protein [Corynebacterium bovis]MBB3116917.1 putative small lipoprotein YifL [Corynebacterium bovis DSM 20582 = CIP 54.80]MBB3116980.1 putative small lipoprotein YifL [Corynebacterium bovis DSM 20582 = CIP 54.80]QQC48651.1 hypothetical protein I6I09_10795 [Corynebacterium bovis]WJY78613.1 hypothetical protein CBOVI_10655 [Corynebacterium bovis DSM 20582 = CIP 54.80]
MGRQSRLRGLSPALAVAVVLVLSGCGSNSSDVPAGSDETAVIDPVAFDPAPAAMSVLTTLLSWTPAAQSGPLDIPVDAADRLLAGGLRDQATHPRTASGVLAKPAGWDGWAAAGAQVRAIVPTATVRDDPVDDSARLVDATVEQTLAYPDGSRSDLARMRVTVHLVSVDGRWAADGITPAGPAGPSVSGGVRP